MPIAGFRMVTWSLSRSWPCTLGRSNGIMYNLTKSVLRLALYVAQTNLCFTRNANSNRKTCPFKGRSVRSSLGSAMECHRSSARGCRQMTDYSPLDIVNASDPAATSLCRANGLLDESDETDTFVERAFPWQVGQGRSVTVFKLSFGIQDAHRSAPGLGRLTLRRSLCGEGQSSYCPKACVYVRRPG